MTKTPKEIWAGLSEDDRASLPKPGQALNSGWGVDVLRHLVQLGLVEVNLTPLGRQVDECRSHTP